MRTAKKDSQRISAGSVEDILTAAIRCESEAVSGPLNCVNGKECETEGRLEGVITH